MAGRTADALSMIFLLGWFATAFVWTRWPVTELPTTLPPLRRLVSATFVLFTLSLLSSPTTLLGVSDLWHRAPVYDKAMQRRYRLIEEAIVRGERDIIVPPLPVQPRLFYPPTSSTIPETIAMITTSVSMA